MNLLWLRAPLLMAVAALAACSNDEQAAEAQQQTWTLVVQTSKSDADDTTRGVTLSGGKLISCWKANTAAEVYDGNTKVGTLYSSYSSNGHTTLTGIIEGRYYTTNKQLTLYSPAKDCDFSGQDGTPEGMTDYLVGTITIENISLQNRLIETSDVTFERLSTFNKFTLADGYTVKTLKIEADDLVGSPITVTTSGNTNIFYVALSNTNQTSRTEYHFEGRSADGSVFFLGTANGMLKYGKYYEGTISLNPSISVIIETPWISGDNLGTDNLNL